MYSWWWVGLSPETCRVKHLRRINRNCCISLELFHYKSMMNGTTNIKFVCLVNYFWKCTWNEYQPWREAVKRPLKIRPERFNVQESGNLESSGPKGPKVYYYFEKRDPLTDLTLLKFFFHKLFYDFSLHVCSYTYFGSTRWKETKYQLEREQLRWCLRLQISVCSIVSGTQQTANF